jgi:hypothetical protein
MATNVTNQQIIDALRLLGLGNVGGAVDTSGAQNSSFKGRLSLSYGVAPAQFEQAKAVARSLVEERYDPNAPYDAGLYNFEEALNRRGITKEQRDAARAIVTQTLGKSAGDQVPVNVFARALASAGVRREIIDSALGFAQIPGPAGTGGTATVASYEEELGRVGPGASPTAGPSVGPRGAPGRAAGAPGAPSPAVGAKAQVTAEPTAEPTIAQQVAAGITAGLANIPKPKPATPAEIRAEVNSMYGWAAGLADIPEIAKILDDAAMGLITKAEVGNRFNATHYKRTTTEAARNWKILSTTTPGDAAAERQGRLAGITKLVTGIGTTMDPARLNHLVDLSLQNGWDETQISTFLANEIHYDPTKAKTGVLGSLKEAQRQYLVPLSDQAMSSWASAIVTGTQTPEQFDQYLRDSAASLFPALTEALKDPNMTARKYLDPYGQVISKTLGTNSEDIDWLDPKYQRFITQVDDKGARKVMPLADVQRTLMSDPLYKYDETTQGRQAKSAVSAGLLKTFGFTS